MQPVGFEPTPPKRIRPERIALDHSAKTAKKIIQLTQAGIAQSVEQWSNKPPVAGSIPVTSIYKKTKLFILFFVGHGESGFRSRCLVVANDALFQLS